jgi:hypothetical protein
MNRYLDGWDLAPQPPPTCTGLTPRAVFPFTSLELRASGARHMQQRDHLPYAFNGSRCGSSNCHGLLLPVLRRAELLHRAAAAAAAAALTRPTPRLDPAVTSVPLMTTIVDATGLIIYFYIAELFLDVRYAPVHPCGAAYSIAVLEWIPRSHQSVNARDPASGGASIAATTCSVQHVSRLQ